MNEPQKRLAAFGLVLVALVTACAPAASLTAPSPAAAEAPSRPRTPAPEESASAAPTPAPTATNVSRPSSEAVDLLAEERERPGLTIVAEPTPAAAPSLEALPAVEAQPLQPFAMNLFQEGDFVPQYTFEWCVAASIQMAHNLVMPEIRADPTDQGQLWEMARARSSNSFNGANPRGWATVLNEIGLGPYELVSVPDYAEALKTAASAIRATGRPVGLVMWSGRHAWVMSGFESVGDPALAADFAVTGVRVLDPLYPYGSTTWGPSPAPNSLLTPEVLAAQFVIREPRRWSSDLTAGYLLVLPMLPA